MSLARRYLHTPSLNGTSVSVSAFGCCCIAVLNNQFVSILCVSFFMNSLLRSCRNPIYESEKIFQKMFSYGYFTDEERINSSPQLFAQFLEIYASASMVQTLSELALDSNDLCFQPEVIFHRKEMWVLFRLPCDGAAFIILIRLFCFCFVLSNN